MRDNACLGFGLKILRCACVTRDTLC